MRGHSAKQIKVELRYVRMFPSRYWKMRGFDSFAAHILKQHPIMYVLASKEHGFVLVTQKAPENEEARALLLKTAANDSPPRYTMRDRVHGEITGIYYYCKWKWNTWQKTAS
jgi:hypothetical protein